MTTFKGLLNLKSLQVQQELRFEFFFYPPTTVFIQLNSAIVYVLPVPQEGSSRVVPALAIRHTLRDRKLISLLLTF